jgi:hypothetical protein
MSEARRSMRLASLVAAVLLLSIVAKANGHRTPIASGYGANREHAPGSIGSRARSMSGRMW